VINRRSADKETQPERVIADPVLDFMRLLWNIEHGLQSRSKWMEKTMGITGPQRLVLRIVSDRPNLSAGELARILHLHPSTITGILQRLVRDKLLLRTRDPLDTRRLRLRLRAGARRHLTASSGTVESAVTQVLAGTSVNSVRQARVVLSGIADALAYRPANRGIESRTRVALRREARDRRGARTSRPAPAHKA
jgi:DNA-binding MarR family transcriptional regulator